MSCDVLQLNRLATVLLDRVGWCKSLDIGLIGSTTVGSLVGFVVSVMMMSEADMIRMEIHASK